ncbi:hypothetical protein [Roseomonas elaeocarpi]|uniref:Uncharacterized protein n=1 Tax=Roseomonas elaeocarpi TaxID=907779 RepID=A0ABV6K1G2_9PROT
MARSSPSPLNLSTWLSVGLLLDWFLCGLCIILPAAWWNWPVGAWMGFPLALLLCWSHLWLLPLILAPLGPFGIRDALIAARGFVVAIGVVMVGGVSGLVIGVISVVPALILGPFGILGAALAGIALGGALAGPIAYELAMQDRGPRRQVPLQPDLRMLSGATALILGVGLQMAETPSALWLIAPLAALPTLLAPPVRIIR